MKNLKLLFLVGLCLVLGMGAASAYIDIDETFDSGTPWVDRGWAYGVDDPGSATIKGISIFRNGSAGMVSTATLGYNMTSGNQQGSVVSLGTGNGKAWKMTAGQKLFFGQSGNGSIPSGGGYIGHDGPDICVAQVGLGYHANQISGSSTSTLIGSVSYLFGNTARTTTTFSLTYELWPNAAGTGAFIREIRSNGTSRTLGTVTPDKFSMLTTVWSDGPDDKWGTIPKTMYGNVRPAPKKPTYPTPQYGWQLYANNGSGDGFLYPQGKGWANGSALTSSSAGVNQGTCVYSFLDTKPASYGTTSSQPKLIDAPWIIPTVFYGPGTTNPSTTETTKLRTWKIAAGPTSATLYVDDLYLETEIRGASPTAAEAKAADYRVHEFDQSKRYRPLATASPNPQYNTVAGLPVELSVFDLR